MNGRVEIRSRMSAAFGSRRFWRSALLAVCVAAQLGWLIAPSGLALADEKKEVTPSSSNSSGKPESANNANALNLRDFFRSGRPANLYRLESGAPEPCGQILQALNAPYSASTVAPLPGGNPISNMFLWNALSVKWRELDWPIWVGVTKLNIDSSGPEEWIVKVEEPSPQWAEVIYWLPPDVDPTKLVGKEFWPGVTGGDDEQARLAKNQISVMPFPKSYTDIKKIPYFFWDVVSVNGKALVLTVSLLNNKRPQRVIIQVLAMRDRRNANEICRIATKALVAGFSF